MFGKETNKTQSQRAESTPEFKSPLMASQSANLQSCDFYENIFSTLKQAEEEQDGNVVIDVQ